MRRILLLDDEDAVLNALQRALRLEFCPDGVQIEAFVQPEAALLRAGEQDFDVVVSDLRMPGLTGTDVLQMIKGLQPDAVRIVLSSSTERGDIVAAVNRADVFRYLVKPWQSRDLIATIHAAFRYRDARMRSRPGEPLAPAPPSAHELELLRLEREEPGITYVDWDEDGNVRLF
jgi:DNA-binding NtrC family response regulator